MHIHLPKPLHGWRQFLGEVGVIVLGVLVALGLEQAAEHVREQRFATQAREAVRAETRENLYWVGVRERNERCVSRKLQEIGDMLARADRRQAYPIPHHIGLVPHVKLTDLRWEANSQAGRTSLFTADEQRLFDNFYFTTDQILQYQTKEEDAWARLRALEGEQRLTPEAIHDFRKLLAEAKYDNWRVQFLIHRTHQWAAVIHLTPENPDQFNKNEGAAVLGGLCSPLADKEPVQPGAALIGGFGTVQDLP